MYRQSLPATATSPGRPLTVVAAGLRLTAWRPTGLSDRKGGHSYEQ